MKLYWEFVNKKSGNNVSIERLTELQDTEKGNAIVIDLDLKYDLDTEFKSLKIRL